ncbi:YihY family inner membrane protein [Oceanospirillum beijerinckii]|uniref:YihY family inner membrane protein n=1 Tax=Oceanospirillum beijerinckii TaxID=64976 RepID=UPI00040B2D1C|nr:YihY family inner membrane protein [Oceanospirillum beijerinckii]MAC47208.1 ribonuclease [Oceanospirillum sp.]
MVPIGNGIAQVKNYCPGLIVFVIKRFIKNDSQKTAASLTYTTLFAIVPLMTVTYGILSALPSVQEAGQAFQESVFSNFLPESGQVMQGYLKDFAQQARRLTAVGGLFLMVTSVLMMSAIEKAFNQIWSVEGARKGVNSFLLYWAVLTLGPILIGAGFGFSSYVLSHKLFLSATDTLGIHTLVLQSLPIGTSSLAFMMLYLFVPNCKVRWQHALVGGFFTAFCFEMAKLIFSQFISHSPSYEVVYGAFAAVPLFLFWIFISWNLVLLGATLVMALGRYQRHWSRNNKLEFTVALNLLNTLYQGWRRAKVVSDDDIKVILSPLSFSQQKSVLNTLQVCGLIIRSEKKGWHLARDLSGLSQWQLFAILPWQIPSVEHSGASDSHDSGVLWPAAVEALQQYEQIGREIFQQPASCLFEQDELVDKT